MDHTYKQKFQQAEITDQAGSSMAGTASQDTQRNKHFTSKNLPPKQLEKQIHKEQKQHRQPLSSTEEASSSNDQLHSQETKEKHVAQIPHSRRPRIALSVLDAVRKDIAPQSQQQQQQSIAISRPPESSKIPSESKTGSFPLKKPRIKPSTSETKPQIPPVQQIQEPPGNSKNGSEAKLRKLQINPPISQDILQIPSVVEEIEQSSASLHSKNLEQQKHDVLLNIPQRKDLRKGGNPGLPCVVETNHVSLNINPKYETAIHYDVVITPKPPMKLIRKIWETFQTLQLKNYPLAFDDRNNAYSPTNLPLNCYADEVLLSGDFSSNPKAYKVVMKFAAEVNLRALFDYMNSGCRLQVPQDALQCIDVVLRNVSSVRFVRVGRCYFSEPLGRIVQLGDGMELWHGHFQSAVIGWKPFLNIDVAHKGFPTQQSVIDLMSEMAKTELQHITHCEDAIHKISHFLKGLKVQYELPNQPTSRRVYRVNRFMETPDRAKFIVDNGQQISVLQYFTQIKKYKIKYPYLPVLWVGPLNRKIYLPAELCTILPGQVINKELNGTQTTNMIKNVTTSTVTRKNKIMQSLKQINFNADPVVRAFGLNVGQDFEKIRARVLRPPALQYRNGTPVIPNKGIWRAAEFLQAQPLENNSWTVINLDRRTKTDSIENFVRMVMDYAKQLGMQIGNPTRPYAQMERFTPNKFEEFLVTNDCYKLIFVIIPEYPTNVYNQVKQKAELVVGQLTQCIKSKTMYKMNASTVGNILLKVNSKLNGLNHTIANNYRPQCLQKPCIIMGADVTHPSRDLTDIPSIAAVTASCDPKAFQYNFSWRLQPARQEIIQDLENIVKEQLKFFMKTCNQMPQRIIFFRDGVSDGQFKQVMNTEVQAIRRACSSMGTPGNYRPGITFLVVQKRHHTRFFPTNQNESDDGNFNVRAGTVVDTNITHPTDIEFYLVSHASIQGVARPTKYRVLWDDCDTSEDELEALTYYLCHMFSRCTRSVSYPAPTYYAHLAALRAKVYLDGQSINLNNLDYEQNLRKIRYEIMRGKPMFFV